MQSNIYARRFPEKSPNFSSRTDSTSKPARSARADRSVTREQRRGSTNHDAFRSRFLRNQRSLVFYLPPGYDEQPNRRFPVLYIHDGQNIFYRATSFAGQDWNVQGAADNSICARQAYAAHRRRHLQHRQIAHLRVRAHQSAKTHGGGSRADRCCKISAARK